MKIADQIRRMFKRAVHAPRRQDALAALRVEPTEDQRIILRSEWQQCDMLDALKAGEHVISDYTNVAYGTRGYSLMALAREGLMRCEPYPNGWRYVPTAKGREFVEDWR